MKLGVLSALGQSAASNEGQSVLANVERWLSLIVDGAALGVPEIDPEAYAAFRGQMGKLALRLRDRLPDEEKQELIRAVVRELENYRRNGEETLRERLAAWRGLVNLLLGYLLEHLGSDTRSGDALPLVNGAKLLTTAEELERWRGKLENYLHPQNGKGPAEELAARLKAADYSTEIHDSTGLRGGGAAVELLRKIMEEGREGYGEGYVVLIKLNCLDMINKRFGPEAAEDCLIAVSAYLTAGLLSADSIFHWSDSALLAILQSRGSENLLAAELDRILSQHRESSVNVAGRAIMLRIPLSYELIPIKRLRKPEDLLRLTAQKSWTGGPR